MPHIAKKVDVSKKVDLLSFSGLIPDVTKLILKELLIDVYSRPILNFSNFKRLRAVSKANRDLVDSFFAAQCALEFNEEDYKKLIASFTSSINWLRVYSRLASEASGELYIKSRLALRLIKKKQFEALKEFQVQYEDLWFDQDPLHRINFFKIVPFEEYLREPKLLAWFKEIIDKHFEKLYTLNPNPNRFGDVRKDLWRLLFDAEKLNEESLQQRIYFLVKEEPREGKCSSVLHFASEFGLTQWVKWAIEAGAVVDRVDESGFTPFHLAVFACHFKTANVLKDAGADPAVKNGCILVEYHRDKYSPAFPMLMEVSREINLDDWCNPTYLLEQIKARFAMGLDPNLLDFRNVTLLHTAVSSYDFEAIKVLFAAGANSSIANDEGNTPLCEAVYRSSLELLEVLLAAGADPNFAPKGQRTPLQHAVRQNKLEEVRFLLAAGADPNFARKRTLTALTLAVLHSTVEMVEVLLEGGANPTKDILADSRKRTDIIDVIYKALLASPIKLSAIKIWWDDVSQSIPRDCSAINTSFEPVIQKVEDSQYSLVDEIDATYALLWSVIEWLENNKPSLSLKFFRPANYEVVELLRKKLDQYCQEQGLTKMLLVQIRAFALCVKCIKDCPIDFEKIANDIGKFFKNNENPTSAQYQAQQDQIENIIRDKRKVFFEWLLRNPNFKETYEELGGVFGKVPSAAVVDYNASQVKKM